MFFRSLDEFNRREKEKQRQPDFVFACSDFAPKIVAGVSDWLLFHSFGRNDFVAEFNASSLHRRIVIGYCDFSTNFSSVRTATAVGPFT